MANFTRKKAKLLRKYCCLVGIGIYTDTQAQSNVPFRVFLLLLTEPKKNINNTRTDK